MSWLWFILVGLVAGWLGGLIVKGKGSGMLLNIVIGVIGAVLGGWLFSFLNIAWLNGTLGSIITATIGAVVLLLIIQLFTKKK